MKSKVHPFKSDHCYAMLNGDCMAPASMPGVTGFFFHDTRHLSGYSWSFNRFDLIHHEQRANGMVQYWSRFSMHEQELLIRRKFSIRANGFDDELSIQNSGRNEQTLTPGLFLAADFVDIFELRGWQRKLAKDDVSHSRSDARELFEYRAQDGIRLTTDIRISGAKPGLQLAIPPRDSRKIGVSVTFASTIVQTPPRQVRIGWVSRPTAPNGKPETTGLGQAYLDIETLALSTASGTCIAAGIPNFAVVFGRDTLISVWLMLKQAPELAAGTLRFLARHQGSKHDDFHDEEPGKILHEHRDAELSRLNELPFATYFGSVDATPLFVRVLADYVQQTGDTKLVQELEASWRSALSWIEAARDKRGLLKYTSAKDGKGLINKCWKDSDDSMSFGDGTPGRGPLAVVEVQGYMRAAFDAGAWLNGIAGGDPVETDRLIGLRDQTDRAIEQYFWMDDQQIYALAVDNDDRQLDVATSNPGHLLWSGAVPDNKVDILIGRLFRDDLWSGWGLRTLGSSEVRYNPLSYHNGSVWPHDTALFGAGLYRYGRTEAFARVASGLVDLAATQHDLRLPELFSGYARGGDMPPLPYVESCRPHAWAAAALIFMAHPHGQMKRIPGNMAAA